MANDIFKVRILNWAKHNRHSKRTHKYTLISNNFFHDAKIKKMSPGLRCLFLGLILSTADNANDTGMSTPGAPNDTCMIHADYVNELLMNRLGAVNALSRLEELQLVTYEKMALIKERKKERRAQSPKKLQDSQNEIVSVAEKSAPDPSTKASQTPVRLESIEQFQNLIPQKVWDLWFQNFDQNYIDQEMLRALLWAMNNPRKNRKTPLGWSRMMSTWLQEHWDKHLTKTVRPEAKAPEFRI